MIDPEMVINRQITQLTDLVNSPQGCPLLEALTGLVGIHREIPGQLFLFKDTQVYPHINSLATYSQVFL